MSLEAIVLAGGKYVVMLEDNGARLHASRYGEPWRNLTGDNLVLALFQKVRELETASEPIVGGHVLITDSQRCIEDEWWGHPYECTNCKNTNIWEDFKYCPSCGWVIHWDIKEG